MTSDPRHELGARGETAAVKALRRAGYKIRDRNYHTRWGEVDIIADQRDVLAFVEVKTRSDDRRGAPAEAVAALPHSVPHRSEEGSDAPSPAQGRIRAHSADPHPSPRATKQKKRARRKRKR